MSRMPSLPPCVASGVAPDACQSLADELKAFLEYRGIVSRHSLNRDEVGIRSSRLQSEIQVARLGSHASFHEMHARVLRISWHGARDMSTDTPFDRLVQDIGLADVPVVRDADGEVARALVVVFAVVALLEVLEHRLLQRVYVALDTNIVRPDGLGDGFLVRCLSR